MGFRILAKDEHVDSLLSVLVRCVLVGKPLPNVELVRCFVVLDDQGVGTLSLEPAARPFDQSIVFGGLRSLDFAKRIIHAVDKVVELRILPSVEIKVLLNAELEGLAAHEVVHDLYPAGSLGVRNHVKSILSVSRVTDIHLDRVRSRLQVGIEGPFCEDERDMNVVRVDTREGLALRKAARSAEICETLLEPQVVPPLHRDEISEPHVRQFVDCDATMEDLVVLCDRGFVDETAISQGDHSHVFHSADPELWNVDLVVLGVGERCGEECLVVLDALCHDSELLLRIQVVKLARATEDSHRHDRCITFLAADILDAVVFTGAEPVDVRTDLR